MKNNFSKNPTIRRPAVASIWYAAAAILGRGIGLVFTPIFTRVLNAEEYGLYTLYTTWLGVFTIISTLEIGGGIFMRALQKSSEEKGTVYFSALLSQSLVSLAVCVLYFIFYGIFSKITQISAGLVLAIFVTVVFNSIINLYLAVCKFSYEYRRVFLIGLVLAVPQPPLALLLIRLVPSFAAYVRIIVQIVFTALVGICILASAMRHGVKLSFSVAKGLILRAMPMLPHFLSVSLISRLDKVTVAKLHGTGALAAYSIAELVGSLPIFALGAINSALVPWVMRKLSAKREDSVIRISTLGSRILSLTVAMLLAVTPEIISFLAPEEYFSASLAAYPIAISAIPYFLFTMPITALTHKERGGFCSAASVLGALCAAAVCYFGKNLSYPLLSLSTLLAYTAACVTAHFLLAASCGIRVISPRGSLFSFFLAALLATALYLARGYLILRITLLFLALLPLLLDLKSAFSLLKEAKDDVI